MWLLKAFVTTLVLWLILGMIRHGQGFDLLYAGATISVLLLLGVVILLMAQNGALRGMLLALELGLFLITNPEVWQAMHTNTVLQCTIFSFITAILIFSKRDHVEEFLCNWLPLEGI